MTPTSSQTLGGIAAKLSDALNDHCITTSTRGEFINVVGFSEIDKALQQAHEAGVAQGRKVEREYIAVTFDEQSGFYFEKAVRHYGQPKGKGYYAYGMWRETAAMIVRSLPPQGDKK